MKLYRRSFLVLVLLPGLLSGCQRVSTGMSGRPTNLPRNPTIEEMRGLKQRGRPTSRKVSYRGQPRLHGWAEG
jgi:hypothetical protein